MQQALNVIVTLLLPSPRTIRNRFQAMKYKQSFGVLGCIVASLTACDARKPDAATPIAANPAHPAAHASASTLMSVPPASNDFEGELGAVVHRKGESGPGAHVDVRIKSPRIRFTLPSEVAPLPRLGSGTAKVMMDSTLKKSVVFLESEKAYVVFPTNELSKQIESFGSSAPRQALLHTATVKVSKLDTHDTVAGISCDQWNVQLPGGEHATVSAASRDVPGLAMEATALPPDYAWAAEFLDGHHLPLRWVHFDRKGAEDARVEVDRADQHAIDKGDFVVPASYRRIDLSEKPGMLASVAIADKTQGTVTTPAQ
jgi:hypothetical protein